MGPRQSPPRRRPPRSSGRILRRPSRPGSAKAKQASSARPDAEGLPRPARGFALASVLFGVALVVATGSGVTAALPSMALALGASDA